MSQRLEKAIDALDQQARRFDKLESVIETTSAQMAIIDKKQDRLMSMLESVLEAQAEIGKAIGRLDEQSIAEMELFLRLSKRVDTIEEVMTPIPGNGNGRSSM